MKLVEPMNLFRMALESAAAAGRPRRLLGLDVGQKFVGLAVSDPCNEIASPLRVFIRKKSDILTMAKDFQTLVSELSLFGFVVGYPFGLQGQASIEAVQVKLLIEDLRKTKMLDNITYAYWDENYTSRSVEALLDPLGILASNPGVYKTMMDKFAAVGILQGYLDQMRRNLRANI